MKLSPFYFVHWLPSVNVGLKGVLAIPVAPDLADCGISGVHIQKTEVFIVLLPAAVEYFVLYIRCLTLHI